MAVYRNNNTHSITVNGVRVGKGAAVSASGALADALEATPGVEELTGQEAVDALNPPQPELVFSADQARQQGVAEAHGPLGQASVAAPLQVVRGDSAAPFGPPTGTITTKQALAAESPENRAAFAPNQALPGDYVADAQEEHPDLTKTAADVQNEQVEAVEQVVALAEPLTKVPDTVAEAESTDYDSLTVGQLRDYLAQNDVEVPANARKSELVELAEGVES